MTHFHHADGGGWGVGDPNPLYSFNPHNRVDSEEWKHQTSDTIEEARECIWNTYQGVYTMMEEAIRHNDPEWNHCIRRRKPDSVFDLRLQLKKAHPPTEISKY